MIVNNSKKKSSLKYLLDPFFDVLNKEAISYCVCGNYEDLPDYTSHDVDIWASDIDRAEELLFSVAAEAGFVLYLKNTTGNGSNCFFYKLHEEKIEFVRIDLLRECAWRSVIPLVKAKVIGERRMQYKNFFVAHPSVEAAMHLLYPLLSFKIVKDKYKNKLHSFRDDPLFQKVILETLGNKLGNRIIGALGNQNWKTIENLSNKVRLRLILFGLKNFDLERFVICLSTLKSFLHRIVRPAGLKVVFIGPDGCGKTTMLEKLLPELSDAFLKFKTFYWRPFLLPPIRNLIPLYKGSKDIELSERAARVEKCNRLVSTCKLFYYCIDYILGRIKYQLTWSKGGLVCFDRYYHDLLVYPERFNVTVPTKLVKLFSICVPKPDLFFYLDVPVEILLKRRVELPQQEMERQVHAYRALFANQLPNSFNINGTQTVNDICREIIEICLSHMAKRIKDTTHLGERNE